MQNDDLLHKWVNGKLTEEELAAFAQRPEYPELTALQARMAQLSAPELAAERVLSAVLSAPKPALRKGRGLVRRLLPYAAAAAVLLLLGVFFLRAPAPTVYLTGMSERQTQTLPDGSYARLNADSRIEYQADDWPANRNLSLAGEAFFAVREGSTFTVETTVGTVEVRGTEFNVVQRGGILEVSCYAGSVLVTYLADQMEQTLRAGEAVRFGGENGMERWSLAADAQQASWLDGITKLRKVPLGYAVAELERQFGVRFSTNEVDLENIVSVNFQHENLEQALLTVFRPLNVRYERRSDGTIYLFQE